MHDETRRAAREAILSLVHERGRAKTICPSEAARRIDPDGWRDHMKIVRAVAEDMAQAGEVRFLRKGKPVADVRALKGIYRLGLPDTDRS